MAYLIQVKADGSLVKQWDLSDKPLTVGRGDDVHVTIDDPEMSRKHFMIEPEAAEFVVRDLDSRNGTWVNGQRIAASVLKHEDKIRAGETQFVFSPGLGTVFGQLQKEDKGYSTVVREISGKKKT